MPLSFERPSPNLIREFEAVADRALAFREALRMTNVSLNTLPEEAMLDIIKILERLPNSTGEGGRRLLDYSAKRLNEIRSEYFSFDATKGQGAVEDDESPLLHREIPLDDKLVALLGNISTALASANREAGDIQDTSQPTVPFDVCEAELEIRAVKQEGSSVVADLSRIREKSNTYLYPESARTERLVRRLNDAEGIASAAQAELKFRSLVPAWMRSLHSVLTQMPRLIRGSAELIQTSHDVIVPFYRQWKSLKKDIEEITLRNIPISVENLKAVAEKLEKRSLDKSNNNNSQLSEPFFDMQIATKMVIIGESLPKFWRSRIERMDLNGTKIKDLSALLELTEIREFMRNMTEIDDIRVLSRLPKLVDLQIHTTQVADLFPIAECIALRNLTFHHTRVASLKEIKNWSIW